MAAKKPDMSCARVVQYKASGLDKIYRHNERRNQSYGNENVITEMSRYNIHFKDPGDETYTEIFRRLEADGVISTRGLREDATLLDEIIIDVNTQYFEDHGGYVWATSRAGEGTCVHFVIRKYHEASEPDDYVEEEAPKASPKASKNPKASRKRKKSGGKG